MVLLLYGAGLRLLECAQLRLKDVDFAPTSSSFAAQGRQGPRDHAPDRRKDRLLEQIEAVRRQHRVDLEAGAGWVACRRAGAKVPERRTRARAGSGHSRTGTMWIPHRPAPPPPPARVRRPACRQARAAPGRRHQACELSHVPAFIRTHCWRTVTTSALSRSCSDIATSARR